MKLCHRWALKQYYQLYKLVYDPKENIQASILLIDSDKVSAQTENR